MSVNNLPKYTNELTAIQFLERNEGSQWTIARLFESGVKPWFRLSQADCHGFSEQMANNVFGLTGAMSYLAPVELYEEYEALAYGDNEILVSRTRTNDGRLATISPGILVLSFSLLFFRDDILKLIPKTLVRPVTSGSGVIETPNQRQDRRLEMCYASLLMDRNATYSRLPKGVGQIAEQEGVSRQAFSSDLVNALKRREYLKKSGRADFFS